MQVGFAPTLNSDPPACALTFYRGLVNALSQTLHPLSSPQHNERMSNKSVIATKNAPEAIGPYSQAIRVGDMLFASGQIWKT